MYNLVVLMALGTGADAPAWSDSNIPLLNQSREPQRCGGCRGGGFGCRGGGGFGCRGGGGFGCRGGCYGGGCYGGYGGCYGGGIAYSGCYGGCYGGGMVYGCYGGGVMHGCHGGMPHHAPAGQKPEPAPKPKPEGGTPPGQARGPAPAVIVVSLPADARLTVDDTPTRSTSSLRTLVSPPLEPGKTFTYTLKAELDRDGQPVTQTREVVVRAGEEARVRFDLPDASVAQQ
jgi:uncharacterized protein (TIGR03000 family)